MTFKVIKRQFICNEYIVETGLNLEAAQELANSLNNSEDDWGYTVYFYEQET